MKNTSKEELREMKENQEWFNIFRKWGAFFILKLLDSLGGEMLKSELIEKMKEAGSYANEFYRSEEPLVKHKLISYKLDEDTYEKIVFIYPKGRKVVRLFESIESLL